MQLPAIALRNDGLQNLRTCSIVLISGKATGRESVTTDQVTGLPRTCLERTLIDITVRPRYAGGVFQVAEAFKTAVSEIDSSKLLVILERLNYRYPYHQALGFYLDRAGASKEILGQLRDYGTDFAYYLDYSMAKPPDQIPVLSVNKNIAW